MHKHEGREEARVSNSYVSGEGNIQDKTVHEGRTTGTHQEKGLGTGIRSGDSLPSRKLNLIFKKGRKDVSTNN